MFMHALYLKWFPSKTVHNFCYPFMICHHWHSSHSLQKQIVSYYGYFNFSCFQLLSPGYVLNIHEMHSFEIHGSWSVQTNKPTSIHLLAQCSHACVGLTQAHPNYHSFRYFTSSFYTHLRCSSFVHSFMAPAKTEQPVAPIQLSKRL